MRYYWLIIVTLLAITTVIFVCIKFFNYNKDIFKELEISGKKIAWDNRQRPKKLCSKIPTKLIPEFKSTKDLLKFINSPVNQDKIVFVYIHIEPCLVCAQTSPEVIILAKTLKHNPNVAFAQINDTSPSVYPDIMKIGFGPTFKLYFKGEVIGLLSGGVRTFSELYPFVINGIAGATMAQNAKGGGIDRWIKCGIPRQFCCKADSFEDENLLLNKGSPPFRGKECDGEIAYGGDGHLMIGSSDDWVKFNPASPGILKDRASAANFPVPAYCNLTHRIPSSKNTESCGCIE